MTQPSELETLLADLDSAVNTVLAYFEGPGQSSNVRIGDWGAWEVLAHFLYWHEATTNGMESVARGDGPMNVTIETDSMNAESVRLHQGESFALLAREARRLQAALTDAARILGDLDTVILERPERSATARQRLEHLASHWQGHVAALEGAAS